jgi:hypothetical protein
MPTANGDGAYSPVAFAARTLSLEMITMHGTRVELIYSACNPSRLIGTISSQHLLQLILPTHQLCKAAIA